MTRQEILKERIQEALSSWGDAVVGDVLNTMSFMHGDPDGLWSTYEGMGMFEHAEAVEHIYFDLPENEEQ